MCLVSQWVTAFCWRSIWTVLIPTHYNFWPCWSSEILHEEPPNRFNELKQLITAQTSEFRQYEEQVINQNMQQALLAQRMLLLLQQSGTGASSKRRTIRSQVCTQAEQCVNYPQLCLNGRRFLAKIGVDRKWFCATVDVWSILSFLFESTRAIRSERLYCGFVIRTINFSCKKVLTRWTHCNNGHRFRRDQKNCVRILRRLHKSWFVSLVYSLVAA